MPFQRRHKDSSFTHYQSSSTFIPTKMSSYLLQFVHLFLFECLPSLCHSPLRFRLPTKHLIMTGDLLPYIYYSNAPVTNVSNFTQSSIALYRTYPLPYPTPFSSRLPSTVRPLPTVPHRPSAGWCSVWVRHGRPSSYPSLFQSNSFCSHPINRSIYTNLSAIDTIDGYRNQPATVIR